MVEGARTATAYVFTDDAGDQETFFEWGASAEFARTEAPALDFVHMATADPDFNVRVAEKSKFASFDPGQDLLCYSADELEIILANIDILFSNNHEMNRMCNMLGLERTALVASIPIVVTTRGAGGSVLCMEGREYHVPVVRVEAVDPTGAGDGYRAGFLTAFRKGYAPLDCCRVGAVVSSFVVEKVGTQTNLLTGTGCLGATGRSLVNPENVQLNYGVHALIAGGEMPASGAPDGIRPDVRIERLTRYFFSAPSCRDRSELSSCSGSSSTGLHTARETATSWLAPSGSRSRHWLPSC